MSNINPRRADASVIYEKFSGVGANTSKNELPVVTLRNFRILPDGSLEKRNGWRYARELEQTPRGALSCAANGVSITLLVCDDRCCIMVNEPTATLYECPTPLQTTGGSVKFFLYNSEVYLLDGVCVYAFDGEDIAPAQGYAPLVGRLWDPIKGGDWNEFPNLFSRLVRVNYYNPNHESTFYLPFFAESIPYLTVDGQKVTDFTHVKGSNHFTLTNVGTNIEVGMVMLSLPLEYSEIFRATIPFVDTFYGNERLLLAGIDELPHVYVSTAVTSEMLADSQYRFPKSDSLYFRVNSKLALGNCFHPINGFLRDHNRILALSDDTVYALTLSSESDRVEACALLHGMGCAASMMDVRLDGDPLILNGAGLFRLHSTGSGSQMRFERIPSPYPEIGNADFAANVVCAENPAHDEIWFRDVRNLFGRVLVYNHRSRLWYEFDGIRAYEFFRIGDSLAFLTATGVAVMEDDLTTDADVPFEAICQSDFLDFSDPERPKRSLRALITAETGGNILNLRIETETRARFFELIGKSVKAPQSTAIRAAMGRFRHLRVTISDPEPARSRIRRLALFANL